MKATIYCYSIDAITSKGKTAELNLDARNRTQAAATARKMGFIVRSVNMTGHYTVNK